MNATRIDGMSNAEYHRRPELSSSQVATFLDDPLVYYHRYIKRDWPPMSPTDAMSRGTLTHDLIEMGVDLMLEGKLDELVRVIPEEVLNRDGHCKGKQWTEWKEQHPARHYLKIGELNPFREIMKNLQAHELLKPLLDSENKEVSIFWTDSGSGLNCRVRLDVLERNIIGDWKTNTDIRPQAFVHDVERRHYARRLALYQRGVYALTGEWLPVMTVAIKSVPGFGVRPYELSEEWLKVADEQLSQTLDDIASFDVNDELNVPVTVLDPPRWSNF